MLIWIFPPCNTTRVQDGESAHSLLHAGFSCSVVRREAQVLSAECFGLVHYAHFPSKVLVLAHCSADYDKAVCALGNGAAASRSP